LDNHTDIPLHQIANTIENNLPVLTYLTFERRVDNPALDETFLKSEDDYVWRTIKEDLLPLSKIYPDVCICVTETPRYYKGDGCESRFLFYGGKCVQQYPELIYPLFTPNNFEYWTSDKQ
jgi:hypothetical protein